jgi:hypothetical protein
MVIRSYSDSNQIAEGIKVQLFYWPLLWFCRPGSYYTMNIMEGHGSPLFLNEGCYRKTFKFENDSTGYSHQQLLSTLSLSLPITTIIFLREMLPAYNVYWWWNIHFQTRLFTQKYIPYFDNAMLLHQYLSSYEIVHNEIELLIIL